MSRTLRILIVGVVAVVAVGGYWKLLLAPKRAEAVALATKVATAAGPTRPDRRALIVTYRGRA